MKSQVRILLGMVLVAADDGDQGGKIVFARLVSGVVGAGNTGTSARLASDGRSHAEIGRWDVLVDIPQPVDELSDVERNAAGLTPDDIDLGLTT
jgi:hypothetical protein